MPPPKHTTPFRRPPVDRDDPKWRAVELAQRARMILDIATADLDASEATLGAFHTTTWHFRSALAEARRSWDRLRAQLGGAVLAEALAEPPAATLAVGEPDSPQALFLTIGGHTYRAQRIDGTPLAPSQWRLTRLPASDDGPYYACRLADGSTQCDCAEWAYQVDGLSPDGLCKHLAALVALEWL